MQNISTQYSTNQVTSPFLIENEEVKQSNLENDTKAQLIQKLGLNAIPKPIKSSTPKMSIEELKIDLDQYNPEVRFKTSGEMIYQRNIIELIRKLHDKLLYISYDRFKDDLKILTTDLVKHLKNERYAIGVASHKSNT